MKKSLKSTKDNAIKKATEAQESQSKQKAFQAYKEMAEYLDKNFSPVEAVPQTAASPITTHSGVWASYQPCSLI